MSTTVADFVAHGARRTWRLSTTSASASGSARFAVGETRMDRPQLRGVDWTMWSSSQRRGASQVSGDRGPAAPERVDRQLETIGEVEFGESGRHVIACRRLADAQAGGDILVREASAMRAMTWRSRAKDFLFLRLWRPQLRQDWCLEQSSGTVLATRWVSDSATRIASKSVMSPPCAGFARSQ